MGKIGIISIIFGKNLKKKIGQKRKKSYLAEISFIY